ncbi:MAG: RNA-guided endonuclease InsQ/TnpB family protein [Steroidobacteraceae bacterium]
MLGRLFGAARYVWNWALARRSDAYKLDGIRLNWVALSRELTGLRRAEGTEWLGELPREPFAQVLRDLERAFNNFFAQRAEYPRFKRRGGKCAVRFTLDQRRVQLERGAGRDRWAYVRLPGLGRVKLRRTEALLGRLRSVTLSRDGAGRYFASVTADRAPLEEAAPAVRDAVGVDVGLRDLLVVHDGCETRRIEAPRSLVGKLARLRRYQRHQSRQLAAQMRVQGLDPSKPCPKGVRLGLSHRRARTRSHIARLHARIADQRRESLHRATTSIVREAQVIGIEGLRVKALSRSMGRRAFRRSVADAALGEVRRQLTYKGAWAHRQVIAVDTFFASGKRCSLCHEVNRDLRFERHWRCAGCGSAHERDENAAMNLRQEGLRLLASGSPATGKGPERQARGVACVAEGEQQATVAYLQCRPTMNREPARWSARTETAQVPFGTVRRAVWAGL